MSAELKVPSVGESITEVFINRWLKNEGDFAEKDETVAELETDKATFELPAPVSGILRNITKKKGETGGGMAMNQTPIHPLRLCEEVKNFMKRDAILVVDGQEI